VSPTARPPLFSIILFIIMRLSLVALIVFFGTIIGCFAINAVSSMQDAKMTRFCKSAPIGAGYDELCKDFR